PGDRIITALRPGKNRTDPGGLRIPRGATPVREYAPHRLPDGLRDPFTTAGCLDSKQTARCREIDAVMNRIFSDRLGAALGPSACGIDRDKAVLGTPA